MTVEELILWLKTQPEGAMVVFEGEAWELVPVCSARFEVDPEEIVVGYAVLVP